MRIKRLYSFLIQSYLGSFFATFFICLFIVLMQFLWKYVDEMVGKGLEMSVLFEFFFYAALSVIQMALPLSILLSSLMTFGNLGERLELLAMKSAGISLFKIMRPFIVFISIICVGAFFYSNSAMPVIQTKLWTLLISMKQKSPEVDIPEGSFYQGIDGYNIYVRSKDHKTKLLKDVMIYDFSKGFDNAEVLAADSARLQIPKDKKSLVLTLYSGESFANLKTQRNSRKNVPYRRESYSYKKFIIDFDANFSKVDESVMTNKYMGKDLNMLSSAIDSMQIHADSIDRVYRNIYLKHFFDRGLLSISTIYMVDSIKDYSKYTIESLLARRSLENNYVYVSRAIRSASRIKADMPLTHAVRSKDIRSIHRFDIERHRKFTLSFACLVFFFIGAPLGAIIRKGGLGLPVVISVILFIIYYVIDNTGYKMAREGVWPVWEGIWLSSALLFPFGIFLTYKAATDKIVSINFKGMHHFIISKFKKKK